MIDWMARARHYFAETAATPTDRTDETPVSSVSSVGGEGVSHENESSVEIAQANQWELRRVGGRVRIVSFAPARTVCEVRRRHRDAVSIIEIDSTVTACTRCIHASAFGNCGVPERAGLAERFLLVKHPEAAAGCAAFEAAP